MANSDFGVSVEALHQGLVDFLMSSRQFNNELIEEAFRAVPRHLFLPEVELARVYSDDAIPTKLQDGRAISSSSQPGMMWVMLEQLDLQPGHRVLEIGAGTGYNAAIMARLVGDSGSVTTMDIDEDIVEGARQHLDAAGYGQVRVVQGDGALGFPEGAPYDRIILTVGGDDIAPAWREQLGPGGRLVLPLGLRGAQKCVAFDQRDGYLESVSVSDCGFMRLRGILQEAAQFVPLGPEPGLSLHTERAEQVEPHLFYEWLSGPKKEIPSTLTSSLRGLAAGFFLWLELHEPTVCTVEAQGEMVDRGLVPFLLAFEGEWRSRITRGMFSESGMAMLMRPPGTPLVAGLDSMTEEFQVWVCSVGPDSAVGPRLIDQLAAWDGAGRPSSHGLRLRAYPAGSGYVPAEGESVIHKPLTTLVLDWP